MQLVGDLDDFRFSRQSRVALVIPKNLLCRARTSGAFRLESLTDLRSLLSWGGSRRQLTERVILCASGSSPTKRQRRFWIQPAIDFTRWIPSVL